LKYIFDVSYNAMLYTYWKGTLLSKFYDSDETECLKFGKNLIEHSIRQQINIKTQKETFRYFLDTIKKRKDNKQPIYSSDHLMAFHTLMALCYLGEIDLDDDLDGIFIQPSPRRNST
tara:strand:+ start:138 stop:488 length:351 start_codon:yes stop_codon:yes gene_type:complete